MTVGVKAPAVRPRVTPQPNEAGVLADRSYLRLIDNRLVAPGGTISVGNRRLARHTSDKRKGSYRMNTAGGTRTQQQSIRQVVDKPYVGDVGKVRVSDADAQQIHPARVIATRR